MEKIAYLAEHSTRSDMWSIEDMLHVVLRDLREGKTHLDNPTQAIVILLDNDNGKYDYTSYAAKLKSSEIISLLEVAKQMFVKDFV